jgi:hypothetical protein
MKFAMPKACLKIKSKYHFYKNLFSDFKRNYFENPNFILSYAVKPIDQVIRLY